MKLVKRAEAFTAARAHRPEALDRLIAIAADEAAGPLIQANAVGYLRQLHRRARRRRTARRRESRAPGHPRRGDLEPGTARDGTGDAARSAVLAALDDPQRAVRISALVSLINLRGSPLAARGPRTISPRRPGVRAGWSACTRTTRGSSATWEWSTCSVVSSIAPRTRSRSLSGLEPGRPSARFLLAVTRIGQRRFDEARTLLAQVPSSDPYYRSAQDRLKTLSVGR